MEDGIKTIRLSKVAREFNVGISTIVDFLTKKNIKVDNNPNTKLSPEIYDLLVQEYQAEKNVKEESKKIGIGIRHDVISAENNMEEETEREGVKELIIKNTQTFGTQKEEKTKTVEKTIEETPVVKEKKEKVSEKKTEEKKTKKEDPDKKEKPSKKSGAKTEEPAKDTEEKTEESGIKVVGKIDLNAFKKKLKLTKKEKASEPETITPEDKEKGKSKGKGKGKVEKTEKEEEKVVNAEELIEISVEEENENELIIPDEETKNNDNEINFMPTDFKKLEGPTIVGKIDLDTIKEPVKKLGPPTEDRYPRKKKRKRIKKQAKPVEGVTEENKNKLVKKKKLIFKPEVSPDEIEKQIKETLARLSGSGKSKASKYRRQKRDHVQQQLEVEQMRVEEEKKVIKVTEFVTANELASLMQHVNVNEIIATCLSLGLFVSINQRLDAETLTIVAEEFGYSVEFVSVEVSAAIKEDTDKPEDLQWRHPIVTVMGHVDHGKTSLLDYIRRSNVIAGEAGGITQHIGAYEVTLDNGKKITFLDTPGHEAFTAMRARGAQVTDIAIIVVAADDNVMPQTIEAINHAQAAKVPIVFAINKIDKPGADAEKIKEELSKMNILVEDWGGKYQSQEISAKKGINIPELLDKVLLEAEMLDLKANPNKIAVGTVLESSLEKGRGYVAKLLVLNGTLHIGDMVLAGYNYGRVKAMYNERNQAVTEAGPSTPILLLGLNGAPQAGDAFNVMNDEREVKSIATKRQQLQREQGIRTQKHITLDEIGRRIAIGDFKELNVIVKGDVDGSIEALSDSLLKLSNEEVVVNVIHKSVGGITESDVLLATASNAIIIGFQVRPSLSARKLAEQEQIDIRLYSIIYNAINEIKSAIEGMLSPEIQEKIVSNLEVREVFKITKVGTIAGCMVLDGKMNRNTKVRIIRDGIVVYSGNLSSLKRFKDDVKEVFVGQECGLSIENFNDMKVSDIIEGYDETEVKRKL
jgi:translation initiation factor IF-2